MQSRKSQVLQALDIPAWIPRSKSDAPSEGSSGGPVVHVAQNEVSKVSSLDSLQAEVHNCTRCNLCKSRTQTVFGVGSLNARWMIVGEAPGAEEDGQGEPFVGQAGRLLNNMLAAIGVAREQVYIANVLKCRPPGNRNPEPEEVAQCSPYLHEQISLLQPQLILILGRFAAQALLETDASIASLRGRVLNVSSGQTTIPAVVSYHPAYLLRNLPEKAKTWVDLRLACATAQPLI